MQSECSWKSIELANDPTFVEYDLADFIQMDCDNVINSVDGMFISAHADQCDHVYAALTIDGSVKPDHLYAHEPTQSSKKHRHKLVSSLPSVNFHAKQKMQCRSVAKAVKCIVSKACKTSEKKPSLF